MNDWTATIASNAKKAVIPLVGLAIIVYLIHNLMNGQRGLYNLFHVKSELSAAEAVLQSEKAKREQLEHVVSMLRPESLDVDLLDERARTVLNFSHPNDFVFSLPSTPDDVQNMVIVPTERPDVMPNAVKETNPQ